MEGDAAKRSGSGSGDCVDLDCSYSYCFSPERAASGQRLFSLTKLRAEQAQEMGALRAGAAAKEQRQRAAPDAAGEKAAEGAGLAGLEDALQGLAVAAGPEAAPGAAAAARAAPAPPALGPREAAWLDEARGRCTLQLQDEAGAAWRADLPLDADPLLRQLLRQARGNGTLRQVKDAPDPPEYRTGPPVFRSETHLDMKRESLSHYLSHAERDAILQRDRLLKVRNITGLDCDGDPLHVTLLLDRVAPHLEELDVHHSSPELAKLVVSMASLRVLKLYFCMNAPGSLPVDFPAGLEELELEFPVGAALLPRLRSLFPGVLEEENEKNVEFAPLPAGHCGLRRLGVYMLPEFKPTVLSLLRAHAATLEEVWFFCDARAPFERSHAHPLRGDADWARLARLGLPALRLVVLGRCEVHGPDCGRQKEEVGTALAGGGGAPVPVLCQWCDRHRLDPAGPFYERYAPSY